ncbi:MAG: hypothetical protein EBT13_00875 [Rhodobacteraceae bacterium]|nr:hypothetical protein [Paracoccaceae bacterium]
MAGGRPSTYSAKIADEIAERLSQGEPLKRICKDEHLPHYITILRWQDKYPEFGNLVARAKQEGTHALADECLEIADDETITDNKLKHIKIDTRLKLIGKWNSKAYGDKVQADHTSSDGSFSIGWRPTQDK